MYETSLLQAASAPCSPPLDETHQFFDWMRADGAMAVRFGERQCPGCGVQSVGAQSRAKNPVIEIPTVKWMEGGLLVARPSRGLPPRDQLSIGN